MASSQTYDRETEDVTPFEISDYIRKQKLWASCSHICASMSIIRQYNLRRQ